MSNYPSAHHQSPNMGNMGAPPGSYGGGGGGPQNNNMGGPPNNNPNSNWNGPGPGAGPQNNFGGGGPGGNNNYGGGNNNYGGGNNNNMGSPSYGGGGSRGGGGPPSQGPPNWNGPPQGGNNMGGPGGNNNYGGGPNNNNFSGGGGGNFNNNNNNFNPSSPMGPGGPPNYNNNGPGGPPPPHNNNMGNSLGPGPNNRGPGGNNNLPSYGPGGNGNNNNNSNNNNSNSQQGSGGPPPPFNPNHPSQPHHPGGNNGGGNNSNMSTPSMQHSMPPPSHHGGRGRGGSPTAQGAPSFSNYNNNNQQQQPQQDGNQGGGNFPARAPPSHQQRIHTAQIPQGGFAAPPQTMVGGGGGPSNNSNQQGGGANNNNNNQGPPPPHHGGAGGGPSGPPPHAGGPQHHGMPPPPNFPPNNNNQGGGNFNQPPQGGFVPPNNNNGPQGQGGGSFGSGSMNQPTNNNNNFGPGPSGPPPHSGGSGMHGTPPSITHSSAPQTPQVNAAQNPNMNIPNMRQGSAPGMAGSPDSGIPEASPDLFQFLDSKNLVHSAPLSELRTVVCGGFKEEVNTVMLEQDPIKNPIRMAIDGNNILTNIMKEINVEDPLWLLAGPYPPSLIPKLQDLVENLKRNGVAPVFVFSGMAVHGDVESFVNTREEMVERDQIWFQVANRSPVQTEQIERAFDIVLGEDVEMMVMRHLQNELGCTVFRAPFLQWGQMVAFTLPSMKYCSALWGPPEVLLLDSVKRVLIDLDFANGTISYADKEEIIEKLFSDLPESQTAQDKAALFLDLALLTASHQALILLRPPIENGTLPYMYNLLRQLATQGSKVSDYVCSSFPDKKVANSQTWKFLKGRCYVRHCMVLIPDGTKDNLVPLSKLINEADKVPRNMTGVLGSRLPLMMYYFQFIGLLSVSTMTTVSQNYIRDDNPVSDSVQYRHCMETVISLRTQVLYQLVQFLQANPDYYHRVKVSWIRWYEPITAPVRRPPEIRLAHWNLQEVPPLCDLSKINFQSVIHYSHCGTSSPTTKYNTLPQVLHAIFLKSLDLLGYFTHANVDEEYPDQQSSVEVSGMSCYSETIKTAVSQDRFVEQCVLLIELLRTKSLALTQFVVIDANNFQTAGFNECPELNIADAIVPLASRISSLLYIPTKSEPWPAKHFDRELMTYCVLVRNMHRTLRTTTEVIATSMFLDDSAEIPVQDWAEIPKYLPFSRPPSVAAGVLTKYLLEQMSTSDNLTPADRVHALEQEFPVIDDMPSALKSLFEFWEDAYFVLSELHQKDNMTVDENLLNVMTGCITQMRYCREHLLGETPQASFEGMGGGGAYQQAVQQHDSPSAASAGAGAAATPPPTGGSDGASAPHSPSNSVQKDGGADAGVEI